MGRRSTPRGGTRGKGRGVFRGGSMSAQNLQDASKGWSITPSSSSKICYEQELADNILTQRAMRFFSASAERMELECKSRGLKMTRGGFVVMLAERLLDMIKNGQMDLYGYKTTARWNCANPSCYSTWPF